MTLNDYAKIAFQFHDGQTRKDGITPYIFHPIDVCNRLRLWGTKVEREWLFGAAVLHDVVEDCGDDAGRKLRALIPEYVYNLVEELTCTGNKVEYIDSFRSKSAAALLIKLADRICNLNDFISAHDIYAVKYLEKSELLFAIWRERQSELKMFGIGITNIEGDIHRVKCQVDFLQDFHEKFS